MTATELETLPDSASPYAHMAAGALAGIVEHTVTFPLDSIKTRMQALISNTSSVRMSTVSWRNLYSGVSSVLLGAGPSHALYFGTYEWSKDLLTNTSSSTHRQALGHSLSGALATAMSDALMTPFDVIKQRMQLQPDLQKSIRHCASNMLRHEGIKAFYISYPVTLFLNVPFHAVQFPVYEQTRSWLSKSTPSSLLADSIDTQHQPWIHIVAGAAAGGSAAFLTTPIDVIKTTLQTAAVHSKSHAVPSFADVISILRNRPLSLLFRGAIPRTLAHAPSTALCWSVYEYFKFILT